MTAAVYKAIKDCQYQCLISYPSLENKLEIFNSSVSDFKNCFKNKKYFTKITEFVIKWHSQNNELMEELLAVFEIISSICYNLITLPWREEFRTIRV